MSPARLSLEARVRAGAWLLALLSLGCSRAPEGQGSAGASPVSETSSSLASETAFDLAVSPSGALLTWFEAASSAVSLARFDAEGTRAAEPSRHPVALRSEGVTFDVSLSDSSAGPVLLWLERDPAGTRARAAWLGPTEPALELGVAWGAMNARGNVALAPHERGALAVVRGAPRPCAEAAAGSCFDLRFYELSPGGKIEPGLTLAVPAACDARAIQLVSALDGGGERGRFDYAVCTTSPEGSTVTVFSIQPERQYALAERAFEGCTPLGAARFAGVATFVARCGADRRMASVGEGDSPLRVQDLHERGLVCSGDGARLRFGSRWLRLKEPMGGLELVLDAELAPPGSKVVWTGGALLVARAEAGALRVAKYVCTGSELRELANPLTAG